MGTQPKSTKPHILVLGAYGLIGAATCRRLVSDGFTVTGLGRNSASAHRVLPDLDWRIQDLAGLVESQAWSPILEDVDLVVNCAGLLQDNGYDDLEIVHHHAVVALVHAIQDAGIGLVQISAVGVQANAATRFMATKYAGDKAIRNSDIDYWILRPGFVLAQTAYGGSALVRQLAAIPVVQPAALGEAQIQAVSINDLTGVISLAAQGEIPARSIFDLVEPVPHSMREVVASVRNWLGFAPARWVVECPNWMLGPICWMADTLGWLGWRSPLRSTAISVLRQGVRGDPEPWRTFARKQGHEDVAPLDKILMSMPARAEDRLAARLSLALAPTIAILALFWLTSGLIGLWQVDEAKKLLISAGWPDGFSSTIVIAWSIVDIALAAGVLVRRFSAAACWGMILVSLVYLMSATMITPHLWADPLGPLVKIFPGLMLAVLARILLESR